MTKEFLFVVSLPPNAPTRSRELLDSLTRSHAAKVGHRTTLVKRQRFSTKTVLDGNTSEPTVSNADIRSAALQGHLSGLKGSVTVTDKEKATLEEASEEQLVIWTGLDRTARQKMRTGSPNKVDMPLTLDLDHVNTLCKNLGTCVTRNQLISVQSGTYRMRLANHFAGCGMSRISTPTNGCIF